MYGMLRNTQYHRRSYTAKIRPFGAPQKEVIFAHDRHLEATGTGAKITRLLYFIIRYSSPFCNKKEAMESKDSIASNLEH